jgi:hypothetical protein
MPFDITQKLQDKIQELAQQQLIEYQEAITFLKYCCVRGDKHYLNQIAFENIF